MRVDIIRLHRARHSVEYRAVLTGSPAEHLSEAPTRNGHRDVSGIIGNTVLVNSGFLQAKELLQKFSAIWVRALKNIR
jgi:hypothetical protein